MSHSYPLRPVIHPQHQGKLLAVDRQGNAVTPLDPSAVLWIGWMAIVEQCAMPSSTADRPLSLNTPITKPLSTQHQRGQVRSLLSDALPYCIMHQALADVSLNEAHFPYRLLPIGWNVCFTHTAQFVAFAVSKYAHIGIDVECRAPTPALCQRYFTQAELGWIADGRDQSSMTNRRKILWSLKECYIKERQVGLLEGIKVDCSDVAQHLENSVAQDVLAINFTVSTYPAPKTQSIINQSISNQPSIPSSLPSSLPPSVETIQLKSYATINELWILLPKLPLAAVVAFDNNISCQDGKNLYRTTDENLSRKIVYHKIALASLDFTNRLISGLKLTSIQ